MSQINHGLIFKTSIQVITFHFLIVWLITIATKFVQCGNSSYGSMSGNPSDKNCCHGDQPSHKGHLHRSMGLSSSGMITYWAVLLSFPHWRRSPMLHSFHDNPRWPTLADLGCSDFINQYRPLPFIMVAYDAKWLLVVLTGTASCSMLSAALTGQHQYSFTLHEHSHNTDRWLLHVLKQLSVKF